MKLNCSEKTLNTIAIISATALFTVDIALLIITANSGQNPVIREAAKFLTYSSMGFVGYRFFKCACGAKKQITEDIELEEIATNEI
jgi:hypothetical protein